MPVAFVDAQAPALVPGRRLTPRERCPKTEGTLVLSTRLVDMVGIPRFALDQLDRFAARSETPCLAGRCQPEPTVRQASADDGWCRRRRRQ